MNDVIVRVGEAEEVPVVIGEQTYIKGDKGDTFFPNVSENGDISWSNDGGLPNPPTVNIKGPEGKPGNYTKPASGIPKSDLESAVQASLDKADTALQEHQSLAAYRTSAAQDLIDAGKAASDLGITGASVGDLVRISAVSDGKPTAFTKVPLNAIICNRNLLDNWYFVGGGSQQGGGQFPINQRGQSSYNALGYTIDRWKLKDTGSVSLVTISGEQFLKLTGASAGGFFSQTYENVKELAGKTVTLSILGFRVGTSYIAVRQDNTYPIECNLLPNTSLSCNSVTFTVGNISSAFDVVFASFDASSELYVKAIKLELGSEQTLAHHENGQWVLNEIPDYGQELAKCQRYYQVRTGWHYLCKSGSADNQNVTWDFPVEMRATPTITITNGNNIEEISFGATKGSVMFYKNSDVTTSLGVYRFTASADL